MAKRDEGPADQPKGPVKRRVDDLPETRDLSGWIKAGAKTRRPRKPKPD